MLATLMYDRQGKGAAWVRVYGMRKKFFQKQWNDAEDMAVTLLITRFILSQEGLGQTWDTWDNPICLASIANLISARDTSFFTPLFWNMV
jgi:hypothetical protein